MILVNLSGRPSVEYGIPYPVMARTAMGVEGAKIPAIVRGIVAIFWYGAQTYIASTAVALLINSLLVQGSHDATFLGLTAVGWISFVVVWSFQMALFWKGIGSIRIFLNWAGPAVYLVMIILMFILWIKAGDKLIPAVGSIFQKKAEPVGGSITNFMAVVGTMVSYFAAVILNYGDFSRYVRSQADMRRGNLLGLPINIAFFSLIALFVTAGTVVVFGERLTDPTAIVSRVNSLPLTIVAAITFFVATVGINVVANFIPPANDISNLAPGKISFRTGGLIAACIAFFIGAFWVSAIAHMGISRFVNTLGAILAPAYGVMIADYYFSKGQKLDIDQLYSSNPKGRYFYISGWNPNALIAFGVSAIFSVLAVWLPALKFLTGFDWIFGALIGGTLYLLLAAVSRRSRQGL